MPDVSKASKNAIADEPSYRFRKAMPLPLKKLYRSARASYATLQAFWYDISRFARYSGTFNISRNRGSQQANLTKYYHTIEKGLALPSPRPGFGRQVNADLCEKIAIELQQAEIGAEARLAVDAIAGYDAFNREHGLESPPWIKQTLALAAMKGVTVNGEPTKPPRAPAAMDPRDRIDFIVSRHSVRTFAPEDVSDDVLLKAAYAAQSAPCVCNRQASKVYFYKSLELRRKLLSVQNGNRGFGELAPVVGLVTVDQSAFLDASERYQGWIDGGLFTMNLLLGLHAQNHGACCLNWSALPTQDKALRRFGVIPPNETVITMLVVGKLREDAYRVARSERRALSDVVSII